MLLSVACSYGYFTKTFRTFFFLATPNLPGSALRAGENKDFFI